MLLIAEMLMEDIQHLFISQPDTIESVLLNFYCRMELMFMLRIKEVLFHYIMLARTGTLK